MKIILCFLCFGVSAFAGPRCENRAAYIVAEKKHAKAIEGRFLVQSSIPYDVTIKDLGKGLTEIRIGYRRLGPGDQFEEPLSMDLGARVFNTVASELKPLGIKSIRAEFRSDRDC